MSGFLSAKRTIGFATESPAYTASTLAVTDYNLSAYNINYDPDIAMKARDLARGNFSRDPSISGKRQISISFSVDLCYSGTVGTAPSYYKCLQSCGLKQISYGTGVELVTDAAYSNVPSTIEVVEKDEGVSPVQVVVKAHGCMGNAKIILDNIGEPVRIDFDFKGVLNGITDRAFATILTPTGFDTPNPDAMLGITTTIYSEAFKFNKITIDLGNDVQVWTDPSKAQGLEGARIVDRNPSLDIDPDMSLIATNAHYTRHINNTTGALALTTNRFVISAPAAQIIQSYKPGDREGHVVNQMRFELKGTGVGNNDLSILQGARS
jgi:hypothetical protein